MSNLSQYIKLEGDKTIWTIVFSLLTISVLVVYSVEGLSATTSHVRNIFIGLVSMYMVHKLKFKYFSKLSVVAVLMSVVLLIVVLLIGIEINGAKRWLDLGFITIQVSEVSRLFIMFWISGFIVKHDVNKSFNKCLFMIVILSLIILYQKDFGSTALLVFTFFSLMLVAGLHLRYLFAYISLAILVSIPLILYQPYRLKRVVSFMNPWDDQSGGGYQLIASLLAFGKGGFFGLGLGSSVQKLSYLPESYNDFIFALIAEELGLFFSLIVIILFSIIFFRIIRLANISSDNDLRFASYLCFTLGFFITYQALIHIMVNIGLAPTKGMGLPFISYGGTNLLMMFIFIGLLIRIQIENRQKISHAVKRGY